MNCIRFPSIILVFRITAFLYTQWGNMKAKDNYLKALELCNDHAPLLYFASNYFAKFCDYDYENLIKRLNKLIQNHQG